MGTVLTGMAAALVAAYLWGVGLQRRRGRSWPWFRVGSFLGGAVMLPFGFIIPVLLWGHHSLYGHMVQHLVLGMVAPLGLVFGAPVSLLLRSVPSRSARHLVAFLRRPAVMVLSHPVTALLLNIGGMYLLYLTPLYALSLSKPNVHVLVHFHFIVAGCLFTWAIAGPDPGPARPTMLYRLLVLFVSIAAHGFLAKAMFAYGWPRGTGHSAEQIEAAAYLMYYGGDMAELVLVFALFSRWFRRRDVGDTTRTERIRGRPAALLRQ